MELSGFRAGVKAEDRRTGGPEDPRTGGPEDRNRASGSRLTSHASPALRPDHLAGIALPVRHDTTEGVRGVVLEHHQPAFARRFGPEGTLGLERDERFDVVAHDP